MPDAVTTIIMGYAIVITIIWLVSLARNDRLKGELRANAMAFGEATSAARLTQDALQVDAETIAELHKELDASQAALAKATFVARKLPKK